MLIVISPAKTLDFETPVDAGQFTQPEFLKETRTLVRELRQLGAEDIAALMRVSPKIAEQNFFRYLNFRTPFKPANARPAIHAFKGDVYTGIAVEKWKAADFSYAQDHLRILSGLYGLLRPLDLMQAYRLEMGTSFTNSKGKDLYAFWGDRVARAVNRALAEQKDGLLVNLASQEYFRAIDTPALTAEVITPSFLDWSNGKYRTLSFFAKKARGLMSSWIIRNRIKKPEQLCQFDLDGYAWNPDLSDSHRPVFTRKPAA